MVIVRVWFKFLSLIFKVYGFVKMAVNFWEVIKLQKSKCKTVKMKLNKN